VLAVGGAAIVTVVTVAGGLGIGPGAAMASTTRSPAPSQAASGSSADGATPGRSSTSNGGGGSWLTIDRHPTPSGGRSAEDGAPTTTSDQDATDVESTSAPVPESSGRGKRVVFDQSDQRVWLVNSDGTAARTYLVSGSKHDNLQPGTYEVYSRSRDAVSFDGRETMGYMVRFTQGKHAPIGFHDIPRRPDGSLVETRDQLGTPLSAGCIRQWPPDAKALWAFAAVGTTVVVVA
jgi:lipoprotein-anchoring transpeptidase ErfK/SrfK